MIGEFQLIEKLVSGWSLGQEVAIGPGDDASAIAIQQMGGDLYLQTVDLLIERVHFSKNWGSLFQLGWKSLAVNLSDIAAMGGRPLHTHLALAIPPSWSETEIMEFRRGFQALAQKYQVSLLGGDTTAAKQDLMVAVSAGGIARQDQVIKRSGASPGDVIWVSGHLGDAAAGLHALLGHCADDVDPSLLEAFLQPEPEIDLGRLCAETGLVHAMIDISDGLTGDLGHILKASDVGAILQEELLPVSPELRQFAQMNQLEHLSWCMKGGEDYKLLGASSRSDFTTLQNEAENRLHKKIYPIGEITAPSGLYLQRRDGKIEELVPQAYDHFNPASTNQP
ncbi:MAG: thiamine-phosphate kinase [bacterium]|nr:thiamine-phosphate kinase [bacterium]